MPQKRELPKYRLIVNDCGSTLHMDYPICVENALRAAIWPIANSYADCVFWTVHTDLAGPYDAPRMWRDYLDSSPYEYIHKDGRPMGMFMEKTREHPMGAQGYDYEGERRRYGTSQELWAAGHDMTDVVLRGARQYGLGAWLSFRQNDMHHGDAEVHPRFWTEHPEYRLGEDGGWATDGHHGYDRTRACYNYDYPEVREYMMAPMLAAARCYDIDGIELDFIRHHYLFKKGCIKPQVITDYVREFRRRLDRISEEKGVPRIAVAARAMPGYRESLDLGLDYEAWAREGSIDLLIVGGLSENPDMPVDDVTRRVGPHGVAVYACHDALPYLVPDRAYHTGRDYTAAMAARYYDQGAAGMYLFNYNAFPSLEQAHSKPAGYENVFRMGDPKGLRRADKTYSVGWRLGQMDYPRTLPATLYASGSGSVGPQQAEIYTADDVETAMRTGDLLDIELRLVVREEFTDFDGSLIPQVSDKVKVMSSVWGPSDGFEVTFNGVPVPAGAFRLPALQGGMRMLRIDLLHAGAALLPKRGNNTVTFALTRPDPRMGGTREVRWERCFLHIAYCHGK